MEKTLEEKTEKKFVEFLNRGKPPYERLLLKNNYKRVKAILEGKNPPPYEVEIQPSSLCNLRFKHCFWKYFKRLPNLMGKKEIKEIANKIDDFQEDGFKIETVKFCGTTGEPLVNSTTAEGIRLFKGFGKRIIVYTNGLYLDTKVENNGKLFLDYILEVNKLNLSLDAGSEDVFTKLKGRSGFNRIINNLERIVKKREENGSNLHILVSYVIGNKNYNDIVNAARVIERTGADELSFRVDFTDLEGIRAISDKIIPKLNEAKQYSNGNFKVISAYSEGNIEKDDSAFHSHGKRCFTSSFWACIGPDCKLYACGHRTHGGVKSYGSLLETSFMELWNSKERLESIKSIPDEYCLICSPSSARVNDFMTFLSGLLIEETNRLNKKYIENE